MYRPTYPLCVRPKPIRLVYTHMLQKRILHASYYRFEINHTLLFICKCNFVGMPKRRRRTDSTNSQNRKRLKRESDTDTDDDNAKRAEPKGPHSVYLIASAEGRTYVGYTNDFARRLRQHNGQRVGGAKATRRGTDWAPVLLVTGFKDYRTALKAEWSFKAQRLRKTATKRWPVAVRYEWANGFGVAVRRRLDCLVQMLAQDKWTSTCEPANQHPLLTICIHSPLLASEVDRVRRNLLDKSQVPIVVICV